jgi:hypothetical protein
MQESFNFCLYFSCKLKVIQGQHIKHDFLDIIFSALKRKVDKIAFEFKKIVLHYLRLS